MIWPAPHPGLWLREVAGWGLAASTAALPLSLALLWVDGQTGQDHGQDAAVIFTLEPMPAVLAVAAPSPAPMAQPAPAPQPEPTPQPEAEAPPELPPLPDPAPVVLPDAPAPAATPDPQAQAQAQIPDTRPKARPKPTQKPQTTATPKPATASGQAPAAKPTAQVAARKGNATLEAGWGAAIRKKIERRKSYPKAAGGAAGRVTLRMAVAQDGRLETVAVVKSSGNAALDQAAVAAVNRAGRLPAAPKGLGSPRHVFTLPMDFAP